MKDFVNHQDLKHQPSQETNTDVLFPSGSEALSSLLRAVEQSAETVVITDHHGRIEYVNSAFEKLTGYTKKEIIGATPRILKSGKHDAMFYEKLWRTVLGGGVFRGEIINRKKNGELYYSQEIITPVKDSKGNIAHFICSGRDITEDKMTHEALQVSEERYKLLFDGSPLPMWVFDVETLMFLTVNEAAIAHYGYTREEFLKMSILEIRPENEVAGLLMRIPAAIGTSVNNGIWTHRNKEGNFLKMEIVSHDLQFAGRKAKLIVAKDVTESMAAQEELKLLKTLIDSTNDTIEVIDPETGCFLNVNEKGCRDHGYTREEFLSMTVFDIDPEFTPEAWKQGLVELQKSGRRILESTHRRKDGTKFPVEVNVTLVQLDRNYLIAVVRDITERRNAAKALFKAEQKYRTIFENAMEGIFQSSREGRFLTANPSCARILGYSSAQELIDAAIDIERDFYVDSQQRVELKALLDKLGDVRGFESEVYKKDGTKIWISENVRAARDANGALLFYEGSIHDITKRRRAEQELHEKTQQLHQAQKMEAIGQLAGGVAHDFNNTLMALNGYCDLMLAQLSENDSLRPFVQEIQNLGSQGANLTRQLLAFGRKQVLCPTVLNINRSIEKMQDMLRRLIGENVELKTILADDLAYTKVDPGQIEQVVMNLTVNARDAMPDGGTLTIETRNVNLNQQDARQKNGNQESYVLLSIYDTGCGMDAATIARVFEPFYTTKPEGKGTGLGLSTVYGIVKQSDGHIAVESQINAGTVFNIYFPVCDAPSPKRFRGERDSDFSGNGRVVLLVDDNDLVRESLGAILQVKGFTVVSAKDGSSALSEVENKDLQVKLLISDIVMPGMTGVQLARTLLERDPEIRVLLMSGYTAENIADQLQSEPRIAFIQKPSSVSEILRTLQRLLIHCA